MSERIPVACGEPHLEDGELVRLMDGELGAGERSIAEAHVAACGRCRIAHDRIAERTALVSSVLALIDDVRACNDAGAVRSTEFGRASRAGWLKAAAIAAMVVAIGALGSSNVRGWIVERWEAVLASVAGSSEPAADTVSGPPGPAAVRARFVPHSEALFVRLENNAAGGVLTVEISEDESQSVVFMSEAEEGVLVLPTGLVIQNAPGSRADYRLLVPPTVTTVTAIVDTDTLAVLRPWSEGRGSWSIPLVK